MRDVDLDLLRCFVTVADLRNFTAAGARLGRSQSAVSIRIRKLEDAFGATLLIRNNQDVQLTERGRALLPRARGLLEESERLLAEMCGPSVSGRLRIGLLEYIATHRLPDIMAALQRRLPGADLHFRVGLSSGLTSLVSRGEIDLALTLHDMGDGASLPVGTDRLIWAESAVARPGSPGDPINLCLMQAPCIYRQAALEALEQGGIPTREVMTANSVLSVRSAVRSGLGVTVLGASCLGAGVRVAAALAAHGPLPDMTLGLIGGDPRRDAVADVLRAVLADHLPGG